MMDRESSQEVVKACQDVVDLFELWRKGIFADLGVQWLTPENYPPAIQACQAVVDKARTSEKSQAMTLVRLLRRNPKGLTTEQIQRHLNSMAPGTTASEARSLGYDIQCEYMFKSINGRKVYRYRLVEDE